MTKLAMTIYEYSPIITFVVVILMLATIALYEHERKCHEKKEVELKNTIDWYHSYTRALSSMADNYRFESICRAAPGYKPQQSSGCSGCHNCQNDETGTEAQETEKANTEKIPVGDSRNMSDN